MMKKTIFTLSAIAIGSMQTAMAADGKAVYEQACFACHTTGAANAPKIGDKEAWAPRIAQGMDVLKKVSLEGKAGTGMIAKGGRADLSDEDVIAATEYMVEASK